MRGQELVFEAPSTLTRDSPARSFGKAGIYYLLRIISCNHWNSSQEHGKRPSSNLFWRGQGNDPISSRGEAILWISSELSPIWIEEGFCRLVISDHLRELRPCLNWQLIITLK